MIAKPFRDGITARERLVTIDQAIRNSEHLSSYRLRRAAYDLARVRGRRAPDAVILRWDRAANATR